jgi:hypothetical protein
VVKGKNKLPTRRGVGKVRTEPAPPCTPARITPREALTAALDDALDAGLRIPCAGCPEWTSDDLDTLERAAEECHGCPAFDACAAAADGETWGAWAGRVLWPRHARRPTTSRRGRPPQSEERSA